MVDRDFFQSLGMVGSSPALESALALAVRASRTTAPVFLEGETGTGKELLARAIHQRGPRSSRPFLALNCAALSEGLIESELFGHLRGSFSGADRDRCGMFGEADGGTLFLDEVCEMPLSLQVKLLRVLQEGEIRPVGASRSRLVDVRILAGANRDMQLEVAEGRFRRDLFHRLQVFPIQLPALRDRPTDIPLLAEHYLQSLGAQEGKRLLRFGREAMRVFEQYPWPGNVRELRNEVHRLVLCADDGMTIDEAMLPLRLVAEARARVLALRTLREVVRDFEAATISARLRQFGYRRARTAESLGLTREGLWQKMRQLGLQVPEAARSSSRT